MAQTDRTTEDDRRTRAELRLDGALSVFRALASTEAVEAEAARLEALCVAPGEQMKARAA
jgi:hypothetical protein